MKHVTTVLLDEVQRLQGKDGTGKNTRGKTVQIHRKPQRRSRSGHGEKGRFGVQKQTIEGRNGRKYFKNKSRDQGNRSESIRNGRSEPGVDQGRAPGVSGHFGQVAGPLQAAFEGNRRVRQEWANRSLEEEKVSYMIKYLPSLSREEIAKRLAKYRKMKHLQTEKKQAIVEYQEIKRKLNVIGYQEIQKENLAIENLRKGGNLTRKGIKRKEEVAQTEKGTGTEKKTNFRLERTKKKRKSWL